LKLIAAKEKQYFSKKKKAAIDEYEIRERILGTCVLTFAPKQPAGCECLNISVHICEQIIQLQ